MNDIERKLIELLSTVSNTHEQEIDCEECLHRVAAYVEQFHPDAKLSPEFWDVAAHLRICPECREEFQALLDLHRAD